MTRKDAEARSYYYASERLYKNNKTQNEFRCQACVNHAARELVYLAATAASTASLYPGSQSGPELVSFESARHDGELTWCCK
jgi:hypothetical protein